MPHNYEECLERVKELASKFKMEEQMEANEDTTRIRFIDTLLFECLGWDKFSQVKTEENIADGVVDYSLGIEGTLLVVEAKKVGIYFSLPVGEKPGQTVRSIESLASLDKGIKQALEQAARYALGEGASFAAVTNGWQVIAFCTNIEPGVSWRKGKALVFENLGVMENRFLELWNALSVEAITKFELRKKLIAIRPTEPAPRRSATVLNFNKNKNRNEFQAELQILGDLVFGGRIFEDRELFHKECYCSAGALPQFSSASRSYLEDRYPAFFSSTAGIPNLETAQTKKGPADALINATNIRKPILLLGDVGVGKTTFIEHLFLVDWKDKKEDLIIIRVDLADKPSRSDDLPDLVKQEIERSLLENYDIDIQEDKFLRGVYHGALERFRKSPAGKLKVKDENAFLKGEIAYLQELQTRFDEHIKAIFHHLVNGRKKMVVLVFDNVDQRKSELQKAAFIQAQISASNWDVFTMLALRPETFVRAKKDGEIAGYHPRAFTISPPRFDHLIEKRISTAIKMLDGDIPIPSISKSISIQAKSVADYLRVLQYSFLENPALMQFCEDISGGNMRQALDYVIAFMSCGHVDAKKILDRWKGDHGYLIPLHEFARGVMYAEREYYSSKVAVILNIFDCQTRDCKESFALIAILYLLHTAMCEADKTSEESGYVQIELLKRKLVSGGYEYSQACWALERCLDGVLVETNLKSNDLETASHVRISPAGAYYFCKLVRTFVYVDAVCIDTPIGNPEILAQITDVALLDKRLERAKIFIAYLGALFNSSSLLGSICDWPQIERDLNSDLNAVELSYARAMERRSQA